ncbi:energy transducer TonB [Kiloniella antarctica]|uniref:Protein TonB n=1 Tax=Kiloniella antarctica TaxID=1550907 RepID=A0ABW5BLC3_9PROT
MQGTTAIRWSSSLLIAITLHTVCWFWADQILPPVFANTPSPQRLTVALATRIKTHPVSEVNRPQPVASAPEQIETKQPTPIQATMSPQPRPTKPITENVVQSPVEALVPKKELIKVRPKRKPRASVFKQNAKASLRKKEPLQPAKQKKTDPKHSLPTVKVAAPQVREISNPPALTNMSVEKSLSPISDSAKSQPTSSTNNITKTTSDHSALESPTFKDLPLITEPAFSKPPAPPRYPKRAKNKRLQGQVILRARVDEQGLVEDIVIWQSSGHKLLDKAAEKAMWAWQFTPAKQAGIKTASWVEFPINFAIR